MSNSATRKRPCSICRKWFLPDARQKGRQKTCGRPSCRRELHRRQCSKWNKRNPDYFKGIYLAKKLEKTNKPPPESNKSRSNPTETAIPKNRIKLNLPRDVIHSEIGIRPLIVMEYFAEQINARTRSCVSASGP